MPVTQFDKGIRDRHPAGSAPRADARIDEEFMNFRARLRALTNRHVS